MAKKILISLKNKILSIIKQLSFGEKFALFSLGIVVLGLLFPWFSLEENVREYYSAFSEILGYT